MPTMKVFNLTDVETPQLKQLGKVNDTFVVGRLTLAPGQSDITTDDAMTRDHLADYVMKGMAAINTLPPAYVVAKEKMMRTKKAAADREALLAAQKDGGNK